ncbi:MAG: TauD/TfdA family dioxygenase [Pseudonocardiaceae bacterium]
MSAVPVPPSARLSSEAAFRLRRHCESVTHGIHKGYCRYWAACRRIADSEVFAPLRSWLDAVSVHGFGVVSGLALDRHIPPTPHERVCAVQLPVADAVVGSVAAALGVLYTIDGKRNPRHIHDVYYIAEDARTQLGSGCSELQWHVEDGCHPARPDWVILLCLRNGPGVMTALARYDDMTFSDHEQSLLTETPVRLRLDDSYQRKDAVRTDVRTLLATTRGMELIYDPAYTVVEGAATREILALMVREIARARFEVMLRAGDLLVFNNRRTVHWRSAFAPHTSARERWIKRALVLSQDPDTVHWVAPGVVHA